ncbi:VOC family protein [Parvibaculum sp.]|uniref:VOC family protein n=1 Tax=Parvibaculum sp. TaxID=2024848 RepID=UPI002CACFCD1|nr:VOC family protein [Parvibaculum sp.]HUD50940.1 VOC family protein [Parvibaculum sp.]
MPDDRIEVIGVDHIYLTVSDMGRAERFYDAVLGLLDFRKSDREIAGAPHRHYFNRIVQITIRPARPGHHAFDAYSPGLHHLCLTVATPADVDRFAAAMRTKGLATSAPALHREYADDYYATFFEDPDGLRHEVMARRAGRDLIVRRWEELTEFLNPVQKLTS